jgi:hypothetical protein
MQKRMMSAVGLSLFLLLGSAPGVVRAHEGHDHRAHHQSDYGDEDEETRPYDSDRYDEQRNRSYEEDAEDGGSRSSTRRSRVPEQDYPAPRPRDQRNRPW